MANWWDTAPVVDVFDEALKAEGVSGKEAAFARSIYQQESGGGRNTRTSNAGAVGGMQIIPDTFKSVADQGWDINDPVHNARAGVRYALQGFKEAGGDPALAGAYYYGGPGGLAKARQGVAVRDPRNPNAPDTLQYGRKVASRIADMVSGTANAATKDEGQWWANAPLVEAQAPAAAEGVSSNIPRVEVSGTSADPTEPETPRVEVRGTSADVGPAPTGGERFRRGLMDPITGGAQLLTRMLPEGVVQAGNQLNNKLAALVPGLVAPLPVGGVDQQVREDEAAYQARRQAAGQTGVDWARMGGNVVGGAALAPAGVAAAATRLGATGAAAVMGGTSAALTPITEGNPDDYANAKLKQVGIGAVAGVAGDKAVRALGRVISPNASRDATVQTLRAEGVRPSLGQTLGGTADRIEQRLSSVPLVGDAISNARRGAQDDLRRAAQNRVTDAIGGQRVQVTGTEGVEAISRQVDDAYAAARNALGSFRLDGQAQQDISSLMQKVGSIGGKEQRQFASALAPLQQDISRNGTISAAIYKRVDSHLGELASKFRSSTDGYQQQLGDALAEMQRAIRDAGARSNPQAAKLFKEADTAFANLVRVQDASKRAAAQNGEFTPGQLMQSVRSSDQSVRKNAVAKGDALMQDLALAGQRLSNTVPNSGTADRLASMASGGALVTNPLLTLGVGAVGAGLYSQPAQSVLRAAVASRPAGAEAVRNSLLRIAPAFSPVAAQLYLGASQ